MTCHELAHLMPLDATSGRTFESCISGGGKGVYFFLPTLTEGEGDGGPTGDSLASCEVEGIAYVRKVLAISLTPIECNSSDPGNMYLCMRTIHLAREC